MFYTSASQITQPLTFLFFRHRIRKIAKVKLFQEINFNLRLIDMIEWVGVSTEFKYKVVGEFSVKQFENIIEMCPQDILDKLSKKIIKFESESIQESEVDDHEMVSSLINKIKTLKIIAALDKNFESDNKAKFDVRIRNIKTGLQQLKQVIKNLLREIIKLMIY